MRGRQWSRREFIRVAGASALAPVFLQACGGATSGAPASSTVALGANKQALPSYLPATNGPKPDYPAAGPLYEDAFDRYPANPPKLLSTAPGAGGRVDVSAVALLPPPTPYDQNPAWQAANKALNADVRFNLISFADYPAKMGTMMAGNDLPDMMFLLAIVGSTTAIGALNGLPQFVEAACADLTPYLAGDKAGDYPYLAALPTSAWINSGCVYNGKLMMVPVQRPPLDFPIFKNDNIYDGEIGKDYVPKDGDDFKRVLKALTKPQEGRYALGQANQARLFSAIFGAPNYWRLESSGKLTYAYETQEYKDAVAFLRDMWAAGVIHPNAANATSADTSRGDYATGKFVLWTDQFGNGWQLFWRQGLALKGYTFNVLPPFSAHAGQKPVFFQQGGFLGATALKKASPDRIKELLRIMNYLAAPFGSAEDLLLTFGVKDVDYTLDSQGNPQLTKQGNPDANFMPWKYVTQHPSVIYSPDIPNYAKTASEAEKRLLPYGVPDATAGLISQTQVSKGAVLAQPVTDATSGIILGRQPLSDWDGLVQTWVKNGGDQMRKEFMDALQASK